MLFEEAFKEMVRLEGGGDCYSAPVLSRGVGGVAQMHCCEHRVIFLREQTAEHAGSHGSGKQLCAGRYREQRAVTHLGFLMASLLSELSASCFCSVLRGHPAQLC